jgi:hypothetical protein
MGTTFESLLAELRADGHLRGEVAPPAPAPAGVSPWILGLQVVGAWLAAVFLLLFLGLGAAPLIKGASGWFVAGLTMTALAAVLIGRADSIVMRQFLLAASLAGNGALIVGAGMFGTGMFGTGGAAFFMIAAYELVLLLLVDWLPHRLVAALVAAGALVAAVDAAFSLHLARYWAGVYWLAVCLLWLHETRWQAQRNGQAVQALACALTLLCFAYAVSGSFADEVFGRQQGWPVDTVAVAVVSGAFMLIFARRVLTTFRHLLAAVLLLAALGVTWPAPAVGIGALTLVFGVARGHRWLTWLGGAVLVLGVGRFYYDLQLTLLEKSALLLLAGLLLLAVRALIAYREDGA